MRSKVARRSGVLLHPSSFPGPWGIGDLGTAARSFIDFLGDTHQQLWQILPLGPTADDGSPYSSYSSVSIQTCTRPFALQVRVTFRLSRCQVQAGAS